MNVSGSLPVFTRLMYIVTYPSWSTTWGVIRPLNGFGVAADPASEGAGAELGVEFDAIGAEDAAPDAELAAGDAAGGRLGPRVQFGDTLGVPEQPAARIAARASIEMTPGLLVIRNRIGRVFMAGPS
jgi:hypothetical protein